jgi:gliding motility-associated-like protein
LPSGCLQIHCTWLMVGDTSSLALAETICPGDSLALAGQWFYEAGQYALSLGSAEGCDSLVLLDLSWWELPGFSILPSDTSIFEGESVEIIVIGAGALAYQWTPAEGLDCDACAAVVAAPEATTTYQAAVWDENGCRQILQSQVEVRIDCDPQRIQIPSAFTPDGDGINDTFGVLTRAGRELVLEMQVWNRWGQSVFHSREAQARWDGGGAPSDVYVYRIAVGCPDGSQAIYTGEISLLK